MGLKPKWYLLIASVLLAVIIISASIAYRNRDSKNEDYYDLEKDAMLPFENKYVRIQEVYPYYAIKFSFLRDNAEVQVFELTNLGSNVRVYGSGHNFSIFGSQGYLKFTFRQDWAWNDFYAYEVRQSDLSNGKILSCFKLQTNKWSWFGGPSQKRQYWPVEKQSFVEDEYAPKRDRQINVAERYWLNSVGSFIFFLKYAPIAVSQNLLDTALCVNIISRYFNNLEYVIGVGSNSRHAHQMAVLNYLKDVQPPQNINMFRYPMWSTGARFGKNINETGLLQYANEITQYGFDRGQISIDDGWESCYGTLEFDEQRFPTIKNIIKRLKSDGFQLTMWVHPFVNKQCTKLYTWGVEQSLFTKDVRGNVSTTWWNSEKNDAAHINFLNSTADNWFHERLKTFMATYDIDNFKFDGGEIDLMPWEYTPRQLMTEFYIRAAGLFGGESSIGVGSNSQFRSLFLRMASLDSTWSWNNGLPNLLTKILHLSIIGYKHIVPDIVGGNGINGTRPDKELYIRWMQAITFMPVVHFSYAPWDYDEQTINICRTLLNLRKTVLIDISLNNTDATVFYIKPIWWLDPDDRIAQQVDDEFLVGGRIISAPVVRHGEISRHIYIPKGFWIDGNTNQLIKGPKWLIDYSAPLDVLPHFIKYTLYDAV